MKIAVSACLIGEKCNFNGIDLFDEFVAALKEHPQIKLLPFCPENEIFGTPRPNLRIVGGDGYAVMRGEAKVIDQNGQEVTESQMRGALLFLNLLLSEKVDSAILMDGSPSCGSNMLLEEENWPSGGFKAGVGVTTALLRDNGIRVLSNFDRRSIGIFLQESIPGFSAPQGLNDLRDNPKFAELF